MATQSARPAWQVRRWLGMLGSALAVVLAVLWYLGGPGDVHTSAPGAAVAATPERMARGQYLARIGNCAVCHTARGGDAYAGGRAIETPFGAVYASNLTPDAQHGIGGWSADDFWNALHHGVSRDGHVLYPAFPYTSYSRIERDDADALFAYLQSLPASATAVQAHALRWPYNSQLALRVWRALYFQPAPAQEKASPAGDADWQRGAYLVQGLGHCMECHAARNALGAPKLSGAGGYVLPGVPWYAPSLVDGAEASVAGWTQAEVVQFLQTGANAHAHASGPMAEVVLHGTKYLSDADARAMAAYLRALPAPGSTPSGTAGTASGTEPRTSNAQGARLYQDHCADCHGAHGEGVAGAYPALAGNRAVTMANTNNPVLTVLGGGFAPSTHGNPRPYGMPPFLLQLSDADIAAVLSHVRSSWGNQAGAVSEFDINKLRRSQVP